MCYEYITFPCINRNVATTQREARQALRHMSIPNSYPTADLHRNFLNAIDEAVIGVDATRRIFLFNPAAERLFACRADDVLGQEIDLLLPQRNRELAALNAIMAAISSSLELSEVLAMLQYLLAETLEIPGGTIFSYNEEENQLSLELTWGLPADVITEYQAFPAVLFHSQAVLRDKQPLRLADFRQIASFVALGLDSARAEWQGYLCVPLLARGAVQGVLELFSRAPQVFSQEQVDFFGAVGQQVGVAIHNARLFEEVRAGRERLQTLSRRLVEVQEMERRHIARELHDEIGQALTGLKFTLERSARLAPDAAQSSLSEAQALVNMLMGRVRELSLDLRPAMLDDLGLLPALLWHIERYTAQSGVRVVLKHAGLERRFPPEVETAAYRIVQEGLTNVARHAGTKEATLRLWVDQNALNVQIEDHGAGFNAAAALASGASSGLAGMHERASLLGGRLTIEATPGAGTLLSAELPLAGRDAPTP